MLPQMRVVNPVIFILCWTDSGETNKTPSANFLRQFESCLGPVNTNLDIAVATEKVPIKERGVSLVVLNDRRATPSGTFSAATPALKVNLLGLGPFFHPTALAVAYLEQPNSTPFALLAEKMAASSGIQISVNRP